MKTFFEKETIAPFPRARSWLAAASRSSSVASSARRRALGRSMMPLSRHAARRSLIGAAFLPDDKPVDIFGRDPIPFRAGVFSGSRWIMTLHRYDSRFVVYGCKPAVNRSTLH